MYQQCVSDKIEATISSYVARECPQFCFTSICDDDDGDKIIVIDSVPTCLKVNLNSNLGFHFQTL